MKSTDSFAFLADTILGELEKVSRVDIECTKVSPDGHSGTSGNLRVKALNGQHSAGHYLHYLNHIRSETMTNLRETIPQITPDELEIFIDYLLRRIRMIIRTVQFNDISGTGGRRRPVPQWSARRVTLRCNGKTSHQPGIIDDALAGTRRHAWIFYLVVKKLEERVTSCAGAMLNIPASSPSKPPKPFNRFRLNCTVAFVGALLRVLCDRNIIENPNIAELCRLTADSCCTARQNILSARGIRNCFDDPTPETLEKLLKEIKIWVTYIEKFIPRQRL